VRRILDGVRNPIHRGCFSLIYGCGLRISEAATLQVIAIDKTSGLLRVVGKGNKERVVPVPKPVHESLRRMWQAEDHRDRRWLFPNSWRTGPVTTNVLVRTFADAVKAADLPSGRRAPIAGWSRPTTRVSSSRGRITGPKGLHRIRHYGLFANGSRVENVSRARELLGAPPTTTNPEKPTETEASEPSRLSSPCPCCGGPMLIIETFERGSASRYRPTAAIRIDTS
jgi:integrase